MTGGGSGIGRAIALRFALEGARVIVNDLKAEAAQATVDTIAAGSEAQRGRGPAADLSDSGQVRQTFAEVDRDFGAPTALTSPASGSLPTAAYSSARLGVRKDYGTMSRPLCESPTSKLSQRSFAENSGPRQRIGTIVHGIPAMPRDFVPRHFVLLDQPYKQFPEVPVLHRLPL